MASSNLLVAGVAVVDEDKIAGLLTDRSERSDLSHVVLRNQRCVDTFAFFGMNRKTLNIIKKRDRRRNEPLRKTAVVFRHAQLAAMIEHFDRKCVEELVPEDDERSLELDLIES